MLGSHGNKFYIMLAGSVAVKIPNSNINDFARSRAEYFKLKEKATNEKHI